MQDRRAVKAPEEIADGVYRLGTRWVNWYLLEANDRLTLVDCGFAGYYSQLTGALTALGLKAAAIESVVLTHYHPDHVGFAQRVHAETDAVVLAPAGDAEGVRGGKVPLPPGLAANSWRPAMMRYLAHVTASRGTKVRRVESVRSYSDSEVIDSAIPLRAIHTPGHTGGHCALVAESRGLLFAGDALATVDFFTREPTVRLLQFNEDAAAAKASLVRIAEVEAGLIAPGHGDVFRGSPAEAVSAIREAH